MGRSRGRAALYLAERENGMTYEQIATKYGVSKQRVGQVCGTKKEYQFRVVGEKGCVYKNLREWMNKNKISRNELLRMMGYQTGGKHSEKIRSIMTGNSNPNKDLIDKMLKATGMKYEVLFEV